MTPFAATLDMSACPTVRVVQDPQDLSAIRDPDVDAVLWRRAPLPAFQNWIDGLVPDALPSLRAIFRPDEVGDILTAACDASRTPHHAERDRLIDDAAALATMFAGVMGAPYLRLRFDVIDTNACCKFHTDTISARLICTYRGHGTHYGLASDGRDPETILSTPTGSPMIFRGNQWRNRSGDLGDGKPPTRLVHRSPPIEGTGETRLVLVIDPIHEPANEV